MLAVKTREVSLSVLIDGLAVLFSFCVLLIAACVFLFARTYMGGGQQRFVLLLALFVLSINILIYSSSLVGLLLG